MISKKSIQQIQKQYRSLY